MKTALLSVSNKTGIIDFAKSLQALNFRIISTGGTAKTLLDAGINVTKVSDITGFPEMMNGRVKTLHPKIHGGILGLRDQHQKDADDNHIEWIDMVVCNLYPFQEVIKKNVPMDVAIENIDIGGPCMIRAAAKNHQWVSVVVDPGDYDNVINELEDKQEITQETRLKLATKAFAMTAEYDNAIQGYLHSNARDLPSNGGATHGERPSHEAACFARGSDRFVLGSPLRYGENPHQSASVYHDTQQTGPSILTATQHQGKQLSFNNIADADMALSCVNEFNTPACVVIKHATPCGVGLADTIDEAFQKAHQADPMSAFGGIIALNQACTENIATQISELFVEIVIAPSFSNQSLEILKKKKNLRVLALGEMPTIQNTLHYKHVSGGLLVQDKDIHQLDLNELNCVTEIKPDNSLLKDLMFSWQVVKNVRSNAIVIAKNQQTIGIGGGQVSRVDAVELAIKKAEGKLQSAVLASDAFFPFRDSIDCIAAAGIKAIIQPGGSVNDEKVIAACNELGIAMIFTGVRCFLH